MKSNDNAAASMIKRGWLLVAWVTVCVTHSACQPQTASGTGQPPKAIPSPSVAADSVTAAQTVVAFLIWYKNHMQAANQIELVNQQAGKPYSVNLKNGERYLAYLKSSQLLTDAYLNEWRTFFAERQEGFRLSPQTEGPSTGFDYDLVMLNQDVDMQLASLTALKIKRVKIEKEHATVSCVLVDTYDFRLVKQADRWMINEILNLSAE